jgi:uncharacterized DUF497 family protein
MAIAFDWDSNKASANFRKHGITFNEAATVFGDPLSSTFYDPDHSQGESRFITIGLSDHNKILIVSHVDRRGIMRIISAREATRHERKFYEEEK